MEYVCAKTRLPGYDKQVEQVDHPDLIGLELILFNTKYNCQKLGERCRSINNFDSVRLQPKTFEVGGLQYIWRSGLYFNTKKGRIAILIPQCENKDPTSTITVIDRPMAVFTSGKVKDSEIESTIKELCFALNKEWASTIY